MSVLSKLLGEKVNKEEKNNNQEDKKMNDYSSCDIEYLVMPNKGVVVCKVYGCAFIPLDRIEKHSKLRVPVDQMRKYMVDDVFVGVAKCAPDDHWDEELGRKIALTKAKAKRGRAVNSAVRKFIKDYTKQLDMIAELSIHDVPDVNKIVRGEE